MGQAVLSGGVGGLRPGGGEAMILGATLLWAVEVIVAKRLLAGLSPLTVGVARMGLGVVALLGWLTVMGRAGDLAGLQARQWGWALLAGAILAVYVAGWYAALARAQAVDVTAVAGRRVQGLGQPQEHRHTAQWVQDHQQGDKRLAERPPDHGQAGCASVGCQAVRISRSRTDSMPTTWPCSTTGRWRTSSSSMRAAASWASSSGAALAGARLR